MKAPYGVIEICVWVPEEDAAETGDKRMNELWHSFLLMINNMGQSLCAEAGWKMSLQELDNNEEQRRSKCPS